MKGTGGGNLGIDPEALVDLLLDEGLLDSGKVLRRNFLRGPP